MPWTCHHHARAVPVLDCSAIKERQMVLSKAVMDGAAQDDGKYKGMSSYIDYKQVSMLTGRLATGRGKAAAAAACRAESAVQSLWPGLQAEGSA